MTNKHTPGPWYHRSGLMVSSEADGSTVAHCKLIADADLIAEAPEMLRVLQGLSLRDDIMEEGDELGAAIRAILARIEGRAS